MSALPFEVIMQSTAETLYVVVVSGIISLLGGLPLGILLFATRPSNVLHNRWCQLGLTILINIVRAIPFIILLIALLPLTRLLVGTTIGVNAAIVPLSIAAIPFVARIVESALTEVASPLTETGQAMGASTWQIIRKIWLPEAWPAIIHGLTIVWISLVGYSAMAGVVGGGGLGSLAINYGYQRFEMDIVLETVLILIAIVYTLQYCGEWLAKRLTH